MEPDKPIEDHSNGDLWDEDTGEYICTIPLPSERTIPVNISIYYEGFWYVFKVDSRHVDDPEATAGTKPLSERLDGDVMDLTRELNRKDVTEP